MRAREFGLAFLTAVAVAGCGAGTPQNEATREAMLALPPLTTSSEEARREFSEGIRELDMNRLPQAFTHFERAAAADPNFALAELLAAVAAPSFDAYLTHLRKAEALAGKASPAERARIQMERKRLDGDDEGVLELARQNVQAARDNPRFWLDLAVAHAQLAQRVPERAAYDTAIAVAPDFSLAHMLKSISYYTEEPRDFAVAEASARRAVELEPNEATVYDVLGDALRAQGKLEEAAQAYTQCAENDPTDGNCLQQRGHVNTFLGRYPEARADYDASIQLSESNTKVAFGNYRAFVHVYAGDPRAAVEELEALYQRIDGLNIDEPVGLKIATDSQAMAIANHYGMTAEAERSVARRAKLLQVQADKANTVEARRAAAAAMALDQANLALARNDFARATAQANEYMRIRAPDRNPNKNRLAHYVLGMVALRQKRYEDAARELNQDIPIIYYDYHLALALEALGRQAEARALYDRVANYYFNNVAFSFVRKDALAKVGKAAT